MKELVEPGQTKTHICSIQIPDLWHIAMNIKSVDPIASEAILDCWHKAHWMKDHMVKALNSQHLHTKRI